MENLGKDSREAEQNYPSLQAHAGWTERHLSKCALPMPVRLPHVEQSPALPVSESMPSHMSESMPSH